MTDKNKKGCFGQSETCLEWIKGPTCALYSNYVLSAWGDWMWQFAAGLYLVYLADGLLRLAAIFGFAGGTLMLLLGGIIGDWVDRNGRMKVVSISLFIQNFSVALCATAVCLVLKFHDNIYDEVHEVIRVLVEGIIIALALIAFLASVAYKIAIEKDWIVVVAGGDKLKLTNLNAVTRAIDLSCKILAPTVAGLIMSYSHIIAAIFIAVWNVVSVVCEYALLRRVYGLVDELAIKGSKHDDIKEYEMTTMDEVSTLENETKAEPHNDEVISNGNITSEMKPLKSEKALMSNGQPHEYEDSDAEQGRRQKSHKCWKLAIHPFVTLATGWKTYVSQKVVLSGLALALLYMTVLGFDYVTTGYIYANGVKESYVGISMALAGFTGIIGTFVFSHLNKRLGLERTGLIAFSSEILCLTLTVASIWAPGTVFDPTFSRQPNCTISNSNAFINTTDISNSSTVVADPKTRVKRDFSIPFDERTGHSQLALFQIGSYNDMELWHIGNDFPTIWSVTPTKKLNEIGSLARTRRDLDDPSEAEHSKQNIQSPASPEDSDGGDSDECIKKKATVSIILFLIGIVLSRVGLWMADLVVTQLFQENVDELERGIVNGVQNSLNMLMDMIKNALVIALPHVETFGILILLSYIFIVSAGGLFLGHVIKADKSVFLCGVRQKTHLVVIDQVEVNADDNDKTPDV